MRLYRMSAPSCTLLGLILTTCTSGTGPSKTAVARFLNGATPGGASMSLERSGSSGPSGPLAVPADGSWRLSPDKVTMTLVHVSLGIAGNQDKNSVDVNCTVTFDKLRPSLTQLADCPFQVAPEAYTVVALAFSPTMQVLINDPVNGFYSTASGIVTAPPAGGAAPLSLTLTGLCSGSSPNVIIVTPLRTPLVVSDTSTITVSVVISALQSFRATVNGGVASPGPFICPGLPPLIVTAGTVGSVEFYGGPGNSTTGSICVGGACLNASFVYNTLVVFYSSATTPVALLMPIVSTSTCQGDLGGLYITDPKSYLGLDANGNLGWTSSATKDIVYTGYSAEWRMARVSALNGTTTLYCQNITTDPAPTGGSFASGAPNIASPANSVGTYTLLAH